MEEKLFNVIGKILDCPKDFRDVRHQNSILSHQQPSSLEQLQAAALMAA
jgi:hypothetical protein